MIGSTRETQQHPQIEGKGTRSIFGGDFPPPVQSISVSDVSDDGRDLTLRAGRFAGVTAGSTYKKKGGEDLFEISAVQPFISTAAVKKGKFQKGDLALEENPPENFNSRSMGKATRGPFTMKQNQWGRYWSRSRGSEVPWEVDYG